MSFTLENLQMIGGTRKGKAPTFWTYSTLDAHATVDDSGYFNAAVAYAGAYGLMEPGDIVYVVVWATAIGTGGTVSTYGTHIIMTKSAGVLNASTVTVNVVTNSD